MGPADDADYSDMGAEYSNKKITIDYADSGSQTWDEDIKDMEEEYDVTIDDAQNIQWTCSTKAAADLGSDGTLSDCTKAKVLYLKKENSDAKKCLAAQIGSAAVMILASVF